MVLLLFFYISFSFKKKFLSYRTWNPSQDSKNELISYAYPRNLTIFTWCGQSISFSKKGLWKQAYLNLKINFKLILQDMFLIFWINSSSKLRQFQMTFLVLIPRFSYLYSFILYWILHIFFLIHLFPSFFKNFIFQFGLFGWSFNLHVMSPINVWIKNAFKKCSTRIFGKTTSKMRMKMKMKNMQSKNKIFINLLNLYIVNVLEIILNDFFENTVKPP